jgi:hypothetical protein
LAGISGIGLASGLAGRTPHAPLHGVDQVEPQPGNWPSVEPADDYTAASLLAFALGAAGHGRS